MRPVSRLLLRNAARIHAAGTLLAINLPVELTLAATPGDWRPGELFTQDYGDLRRWRAAGQQAEFGVVPPGGPRATGDILLVLPREKDRLRMLLHWSATVLDASGSVWLAGENQGGARSAGRHLEAFFQRVEKTDSARHCTLYRARSPAPVGAFDLASYYTEWTCTTGSLQLRLSSLPGVFAQGRIDQGTELLLETLVGRSIGRRALDFGCGCGILGIALKLLNPGVDITLVDSSAAAIAATRHALAANGLEASVLASDGFSEVAGRFDLIVSNPPFHEGHVTRPDMSTRLLAPARNFLNPGGQLMLVTNRHLPYRRWLDAIFGGHEVLARDNRFQVLLAVQS
jgi:16S rRNA (guanine1207-N2)-methyltransferase